MKLEREVIDQLEISFSFHTILSHSLCCFQNFNEVLFFKETTSNCDNYDSTVFSLQILLSEDPNNVSVPGLYFEIDGDLYLVDHTSMGQITFPKNAVDSKQPPSAYISWPGIQLRIWIQSSVPDGVSVHKLSSAVASMNKTLKRSHVTHPSLPKCRHAIPSITNQAVVGDALNSTLDSFLEFLTDCNTALQLSFTTPAILCTQLTANSFPSDMFEVGTTIPGVDPLFQESFSYETIAHNYLQSQLSESSRESIERELTTKKEEAENRIKMLLDAIYPTVNISGSSASTNTNSATASTTHQVIELIDIEFLFCYYHIF